MDVDDQLYSPMDTISCDHLTLAVYPMFLVIGQLCFDSCLFFPQNQYLKIDVDKFAQFIDHYVDMLSALYKSPLTNDKISFGKVNFWQIVKDGDRSICVLENAIGFKLSLKEDQLANLYHKFQIIMFKTLCLPSIYFLTLSKFAIFLIANSMYTPQVIKRFSYDSIEVLLMNLFQNENLDRPYLIELIFRYKYLLSAYVRLEPLLVDPSVDDEDDVHEPGSPELPEPAKKIKKLKQITLFEQAALRENK